METKYIIIPFDVQRAKRISNGEEEGKIVTRDGRNARIVCFDVKDEDSILALIESKDGTEIPSTYKSSGSFFINDEDPNDLFLSVPEWTTFKDGDILISKAGYPFIYNGKRSKDGRFGCYCALYLGNEFFIFVDNDRWTEEINGYASKKEIEEIKIKLKESDHQLSKTYLKRFFGAEEKKECDFNPFDKVLVRDDDGVWFAGIFSHLRGDGQFFCAGGNLWEQCLPYNDKTAYLLGTSNNPE